MPGLQGVLVALIVGVALWFTGRRIWRALQRARAKPAAACGADCGCGDASGAGARERDWAER